jgi:putative flavoprotein involved in K+ transport
MSAREVVVIGGGQAGLAIGYHLAEQGIRLRPRATAAADTLADGTQLTAGAVIWATGFRLDHSFVELPVFGPAGRSPTSAASPRLPGSTSSGCPGSTPADRRRSAG